MTVRFITNDGIGVSLGWGACSAVELMTLLPLRAFEPAPRNWITLLFHIGPVVLFGLELSPAHFEIGALNTRLCILYAC